VIGSTLAGGDSIEDTAVLRAGAAGARTGQVLMSRLLGR